MSPELPVRRFARPLEEGLHPFRRELPSLACPPGTERRRGIAGTVLVHKIAGAAVFLASAAGQYVNGQTLSIDGGISTGTVIPKDD